MSRGNQTYKYSGETTEWDDILMNRGILTRDQVFAAKGLNASDFPVDKGEPEADSDDNQETYRYQAFEKASIKEIDEALEDAHDDDERELQSIRNRRMQEMKSQYLANRFGDVTEITRDEWLEQVTNSSKSNWVIAHLYNDSVPACRRLDDIILVMCKKYLNVKFVRIRSIAAVENYPDRNLPTLFCYHNGELSCQVITAAEVGGQGMSLRDVEGWFASKKIISLESNSEGQLSSATRRCAYEGQYDDLDDL